MFVWMICLVHVYVSKLHEQVGREHLYTNMASLVCLLSLHVFSRVSAASVFGIGLEIAQGFLESIPRYLGPTVDGSEIRRENHPACMKPCK